MSHYIIQSEIDKLTNGIVSARVRLRHPSYASLMITDKGYPLKLLGSSYKLKQFFTDKEARAAGLYLAPSTKAGLGINTCPMAGQCGSEDGPCLTWSGHLPQHHENQVRKTRAFFGYPREFLGQLIRDIQLAAFKSHLEGNVLFVRLNGTSDIHWEKYLQLDRMVEEIQGLGGFYDYTKFPLSARRPSDSYHLTFSVDEQRGSEKRAREYDEAGYPFAVVATKEDYKWLTEQDGITDGDVTDFRWLDKGLVVLKAKQLRQQKTRYVKPGKGLVRTAQQILKLLRVQA